MGTGSSLRDILLFRDKKSEIQKNFLKKGNPYCVLSFGINVPGPVKTGELIQKGFLEGQQCINSLIKSSGWRIEAWTELNEAAGYAAIYLVEADPYLLKKEAVDLEEHHMLGRLFDIDVIDKNGMPVTREQVGGAVRKCLLCEERAKICARSRMHSADELYKKVIQIMENWSENSDSGRSTF